MICLFKTGKQMADHPYSKEKDRSSVSGTNDAILKPVSLDKNDPSKWKGHGPSEINPYHSNTDDQKKVMEKLEDTNQNDQ